MRLWYLLHRPSLKTQTSLCKWNHFVISTKTFRMMELFKTEVSIIHINVTYCGVYKAKGSLRSTLKF